MLCRGSRITSAPTDDVAQRCAQQMRCKPLYLIHTIMTDHCDLSELGADFSEICCQTAAGRRHDPAIW